jgi:hypothetical protein
VACNDFVSGVYFVIISVELRWNGCNPFIGFDGRECVYIIEAIYFVHVIFKILFVRT